MTQQLIGESELEKSPPIHDCFPLFSAFTEKPTFETKAARHCSRRTHLAVILQLQLAGRGLPRNKIEDFHTSVPTFTTAFDGA